MNKMISFRDLIDLEPKPKKVKYKLYIWDFKEFNYLNNNDRLSEYMEFSDMNTPNIEIIEEDKPRIEKIGIEYEGHDKKFILRDSFYQKVDKENYAEYFAIKFNELCDIINDMKKER